jgi:hypothetical protein
MPLPDEQARSVRPIDKATLVEVYSDRGLTLRAVSQELGTSDATIQPLDGKTLLHRPGVQRQDLR